MGTVVGACRIAVGSGDLDLPLALVVVRGVEGCGCCRVVILGGVPNRW